MRTSVQQDYENHLDPNVAKWFAVYTPYKREKLALKHLQKKGITAFLPIQQLTRRYKRKIKKVDLPLINCYVFVKITKKEYVKVLEVEHILQFVRFSKNLIAIPNEEIYLMKQVLGEGLEVNIEKGVFQKGDRVEVTAGNLMGLNGFLVDHKGKRQVVVNLAFLGYSLRVQVPTALLRKVALL